MRYVTNTGGASMEEVSIVGIDLAKQVFQIHGAAADGRVLFRFFIPPSLCAIH
ncbi:hypothetical protein [Rhizobium sp. Root1203]|uniref:hypothetical protein n=1 Tax=Rhizobium sp. Root1203 TaxID=1736427 RepID=UPI0012E366A9|nr:hypothetical protein [Rhizobium sp. Root1203]